MTGDGRRPDGDRAGRQFVKFSFFKLDHAFRRLPTGKQRAAKIEFFDAIHSFDQRMLLRSFSLVGLRGDVDFMLWQVAATPEPFQKLATAIATTDLGAYLTLPHSFLAITRRSAYEVPASGEGSDHLTIEHGIAKYLFVYPFVKTRAWYALSFDERQRMMQEHIKVGRKYRDVQLNTTYSFGIDDQEFVVAFEGDDPTRFVDLVMELRESEASRYTLRDTPMFTCRALPLPEVLDSLGGVTVAEDIVARNDAAGEWQEVARLDETAPGGCTRVYYAGQTVALFNFGGEFFAVNNRCPHSRGPLSDGEVELAPEGPMVTCPWHGAKFDLASGERRNTVPPAGVSTFRVKVEGGRIYLADTKSAQLSSPRLAP